MSKDEIYDLLGYLLDNTELGIAFGEDDFSIWNVRRAGSGYALDYRHSYHPKQEYTFDFFEEIYDVVYRIYAQQNKAGVPGRILKDLREALG